MALLTLTEAARRAGIHRATLYRHMESGKVSFTLDNHGNRMIEASELLRAYGPMQADSHSQSQRDTLHATQRDTPEAALQLAVAQERIRNLEAMLDEKNARLAEKDARIAQMEKTVLLLEDLTRKNGPAGEEPQIATVQAQIELMQAAIEDMTFQAHQQAHRGFWARLFRKK